MFSKFITFLKYLTLRILVMFKVEVRVKSNPQEEAEKEISDDK